MFCRAVFRMGSLLVLAVAVSLTVSQLSCTKKNAAPSLNTTTPVADVADPNLQVITNPQLRAFAGSALSALKYLTTSDTTQLNSVLGNAQLSASVVDVTPLSPGFLITVNRDSITALPASASNSDVVAANSLTTSIQSKIASYAKFFILIQYPTDVVPPVDPNSPKDSVGNTIAFNLENAVAAVPIPTGSASGKVLMREKASSGGTASSPAGFGFPKPTGAGGGTNSCSDPSQPFGQCSAGYMCTLDPYGNPTCVPSSNSLQCATGQFSCGNVCCNAGQMCQTAMLNNHLYYQCQSGPVGPGIQPPNGSCNALTQNCIFPYTCTVNASGAATCTLQNYSTSCGGNNPVPCGSSCCAAGQICQQQTTNNVTNSTCMTPCIPNTTTGPQACNNSQGQACGTNGQCNQYCSAGSSFCWLGPGQFDCCASNQTCVNDPTSIAAGLAGCAGGVTTLSPTPTPTLSPTPSPFPTPTITLMPIPSPSPTLTPTPTPTLSPGQCHFSSDCTSGMCCNGSCEQCCSDGDCFSGQTCVSGVCMGQAQ